MGLNVRAKGKTVTYSEPIEDDIKQKIKDAAEYKMLSAKTLYKQMKKEKMPSPEDIIKMIFDLGLDAAKAEIDRIEKEIQSFDDFYKQNFENVGSVS